jgi:dephospho-CoA kinase
MLVIGIVGGVASGKSFVAQQFRRLGAEIIHADQIAHEVLAETEVREALRRRWGPAVFDDQGNVDRAAVARLVFAPPPAGPVQRTFLEQVTHPRIRQKVRQRVDALTRRDTCPTVVLDIPLLLEAGWNEFCNTIVFVETAYELRQQRALQRGWSEADFAAREAAQKSLNEKRNRADWVIDNSGSPDQTFVQVQQIWRSLHEDPPVGGAP